TRHRRMVYPQFSVRLDAAQRKDGQRCYRTAERWQCDFERRTVGAACRAGGPLLYSAESGAKLEQRATEERERRCASAAAGARGRETGSPAVDKGAAMPR